MKEQTINILDPRVLQKADAICFTSNGVTKANGALVMGAGVAKAFRDTFPLLDVAAGYAVRTHGNRCQVVRDSKPAIVAFPTKHHWKDPSSLELIRDSAEQLMRLIEDRGWRMVALPRPGCRNGGLEWTQVKPFLSVLDDRVVIVRL